MRSRFGSPYDAVLHLLDRQVIDKDGLMVCKVDDLELVEEGDQIRVTALLAGPAALLPRLGGRLGRTVLGYWSWMGAEQADRRSPYRIELGLVRDVTSSVDLTVGRDDVLRRCEPDRTLRDLLEMRVRTGDGRELGDVLDVRMDERHRVAGLIVGPGRPGSLLGYDRRGDQGPALVRVVVRWLHRHARYVDRRAVASIDWDAGVLQIAGDLQPLEPC